MNFWKKCKKILGIESSISQSKNLTKDDIFNAQKLTKQEELNRILDKINQKGLGALSTKEKQFLEVNS